jgi:hypothetical protein
MWDATPTTAFLNLLKKKKGHVKGQDTYRWVFSGILGRKLYLLFLIQMIFLWSFEILTAPGQV